MILGKIKQELLERSDIILMGCKENIEIPTVGIFPE